MTHAEPIRAGTEQAVVPPEVTPPPVQAQAMPAIQLRPESIAIPTLEPNFSETVETENGRFAAIPRVVNTPMKADETLSADADLAPQPNVQIIPGETAPHYRLSSLEEYLEVARSRGGQLVAFDGTTCIGIGKRLDILGSRFHLLDHTWHETYAERMAPLPQDAQPVRAAVARVAKAFPQMRVDRIEILLSLLHSLDRIIYEAQTKWFQQRRTDMNVCSVTEGSFRGTGPYVQFAVGKVESR